MIIGEYLNSKESHGCSSHPGVQAVEVGDGRGLAILKIKEKKSNLQFLFHEKFNAIENVTGLCQLSELLWAGHGRLPDQLWDCGSRGRRGIRWRRRGWPRGGTWHGTTCSRSDGNIGTSGRTRLLKKKIRKISFLFFSFRKTIETPIVSGSISNIEY